MLKEETQSWLWVNIPRDWWWYLIYLSSAAIVSTFSLAISRWSAARFTIKVYKFRLDPVPFEDSNYHWPEHRNTNIENSQSYHKKLFNHLSPSSNVIGKGLLYFFLFVELLQLWLLVNYIWKLRTGLRWNQNNFSPDRHGNWLLADLFVTSFDVVLEGRVCEHCPVTTCMIWHQ